MSLWQIFDRVLCPPDWLLRNAKCYKVSHTRKNVTLNIPQAFAPVESAIHAEFQCQTYSAHLASASGEVDVLMLATLVSEFNFLKPPFTGLIYNPLEARFQWTDGTESLFGFWASQAILEPTTCVVIDEVFFKTVPCTDRRPFVCMIDTSKRFLIRVPYIYFALARRHNYFISMGTNVYIDPTNILFNLTASDVNCRIACDLDFTCQSFILTSSFCIGQPGNVSDIVSFSEVVKVYTKGEQLSLTTPASTSTTSTASATSTTKILSTASPFYRVVVLVLRKFV